MQWEEEEPFYKELERNKFEYPEQSSVEHTGDLPGGVVSSLNVYNSCAKFDGLEFNIPVEVSQGGFFSPSITQSLWLFEVILQLVEVPISWLFWVVELFLIMQKNSMFLFVKIKIKHFFCIVKKNSNKRT